MGDIQYNDEIVSSNTLVSIENGPIKGKKKDRQFPVHEQDEGLLAIVQSIQSLQNTEAYSRAAFEQNKPSPYTETVDNSEDPSNPDDSYQILFTSAGPNIKPSKNRNSLSSKTILKSDLGNVQLIEKSSSGWNNDYRNVIETTSGLDSPSVHCNPIEITPTVTTTSISNPIRKMETNNVWDIPNFSAQFEFSFANLPLFPMVNQPYNIQVFLPNSNKLPSNFKVRADLFFETNLQEPLGKEFYWFESNWINFTKAGVGTIKAIFKFLSSNCENRKYVIQLRIEDKQYVGTYIQSSYDPNSVTHLFKPTLSAAITVVQYRLSVKILSEPTNGSYDASEGVWYKDESGREKSIDILVEALDEHDSLLTNRNITLKPFLIYYGSGELVARQDLLQVLPDTRLSINDSGVASMKFRINDVSKNHQKQPFSILVSPHLPPPHQNQVCLDVAPACSDSITVKSKRTKRIRSDREANTDDDAPELAQIPRKSSKAQLANDSYDNSSNDGVIAPKILNGRTPIRSTINEDKKFQQSINIINGSTKKTNAVEPANDNAINENTRAIAIINTSANKNDGTAVNNMTSMSNYVDNHNNGSASQSSSSKHSDNLANIRSWMELVSSSLKEMQWRQVGIDHANNNQPLFSMANPNDRISRLLDQYKNVLSNLDSLAQDVLTYQDNRNHNQIQNSNQFAMPSSQSNGEVHGYFRQPASNGSYPNHSYNSTMMNSSTHINNTALRAEANWGNIIQNVEANYRENLNQEQYVFYVIASLIHSRSSFIKSSQFSSQSQFDQIIGSFCAFDSDMKLVGFYKEMLDEYNVTIISFRPLSGYVPKSQFGNKTINSNQGSRSHPYIYLTNEEIAALEQHFIQALSDSSGSRRQDIFSLDKCQNDLDKMKQECMMQLWLSEVDILGDDLA